MIHTGGTLIAGAGRCSRRARPRSTLCATHGLFSGDAFEQLASSDLTGLVVTDTVAIDPVGTARERDVLPVSRLLAETIMNVFDDDSVSAIFAGETSSSRENGSV